MSTSDTLLVTVGGGLIVAATCKLCEYCWKHKRIRSALIQIFIQIAALLLLWTNDRHHWSLWLIAFGAVVYLAPPVVSFIQRAQLSIERYEVIVDLVVPFLLCSFLLSFYIPSYLWTPKINTIEKHIQSIESAISTNLVEITHHVSKEAER